MKIPYKHASCLYRFECKYQINLSDKLFQLGHEHEIHEIFDIELTPNRGDCLSLKGIIKRFKHFL